MTTIWTENNSYGQEYTPKVKANEDAYDQILDKVEDLQEWDSKCPNCQSEDIRQIFRSWANVYQCNKCDAIFNAEGKRYDIEAKISSKRIPKADLYQGGQKVGIVEDYNPNKHEGYVTLDGIGIKEFGAMTSDFEAYVNGERIPNKWDGKVDYNLQLFGEAETEEHDTGEPHLHRHKISSPQGIFYQNYMEPLHVPSETIIPTSTEYKKKVKEEYDPIEPNKADFGGFQSSRDDRYWDEYENLPFRRAGAVKEEPMDPRLNYNTLENKATEVPAPYKDPSEKLEYDPNWYDFDDEGFNSKGYDKRGYDRDGKDEYGKHEWEDEFGEAYGYNQGGKKIKKSDKTYGTMPNTPEEYEEYEKEHGYRFGYVDYDVFADWDQNRYNIPRPDIHQRQDSREAVANEYQLGQDMGEYELAKRYWDGEWEGFGDSGDEIGSMATRGAKTISNSEKEQILRNSKNVQEYGIQYATSTPWDDLSEEDMIAVIQSRPSLGEAVDHYVCKGCGQDYYSDHGTPMGISWSDGHTCTPTLSTDPTKKNPSSDDDEYYTSSEQGDTDQHFKVHHFDRDDPDLVDLLVNSEATEYSDVEEDMDMREEQQVGPPEADEEPMPNFAEEYDRENDAQWYWSGHTQQGYYDDQDELMKDDRPAGFGYPSGSRSRTPNYNPAGEVDNFPNGNADYNKDIWQHDDLEDLHTEASEVSTKCPHCDGTGALPVSGHYSYDPNTMTHEECPACNGTGKMDKKLADDYIQDLPDEKHDFTKGGYYEARPKDVRQTSMFQSENPALPYFTGIQNNPFTQDPDPSGDIWNEFGQKEKYGHSNYTQQGMINAQAEDYAERGDIAGNTLEDPNAYYDEESVSGPATNTIPTANSEEEVTVDAPKTEQEISHANKDHLILESFRG